MARANWEWIKVDVLLPGHPKLAGLSRQARWTLVELWCHCGQYHTDGWVREAVWKTIGTKADRDAIVKAELAEPAPMGGYIMHDFTGPDGHQRTKDEIEQASDARSEKARKAAEARWSKQCLTDARSMLRACRKQMLGDARGSGSGRGDTGGTGPVHKYMFPT